MLGLPGPQLFDGEGVGQGAAGLGVRDEDGPVGAQQGSGLGHEVDSGQHDGACRALGGQAREGQGVADVVSHVLDLGGLVVVGEDDRVALLCEATDSVGPGRGNSGSGAVGGHGNDSFQVIDV